MVVPNARKRTMIQVISTFEINLLTSSNHYCCLNGLMNFSVCLLPCDHRKVLFIPCCPFVFSLPFLGFYISCVYMPEQHLQNLILLKKKLQLERFGVLVLEELELQKLFATLPPSWSISTQKSKTVVSQQSTNKLVCMHTYFHGKYFLEEHSGYLL